MNDNVAWSHYLRYLMKPGYVVNRIYKASRWHLYKQFFPDQLFVTRFGNENLKISITTLDVQSRQIYWNGRFESKYYEFVKTLLKPGMTVFDIGANIGQYTLLSANCVGENGEIHSFEPSPREFFLLSRNVEINNISNVKLNNCAVSSKDGFEELNVCPPGYGVYNSIRQIGHPKAKSLETEQIRVPTIRIDSYVEQHHLENIDFFKIDTEGAELEVLQGSNRMLASINSPIIMCEFSDVTSAGFGSSINNLFQYLHSFNYDVYLPTGYPLELTPTSPHSGNLIAAKRSHFERFGLTKISR